MEEMCSKDTVRGERDGRMPVLQKQQEVSYCNVAADLDLHRNSVKPEYTDMTHIFRFTVTDTDILISLDLSP